MIDETRARTPEEAHDEHRRYLFLLWGQAQDPRRRMELKADYISHLREDRVSGIDALEGK